MTSRERLLCALQRGTPDRVPVAPYGMGRIDPESELGQQLIECTDIFGDVYWEGDAVVLGRAARVHTETEGDQTITVYETPQGPLQSVTRRTAITSAQVKFACQSPEDADKILAMPYEPLQVDTHKYHCWSEKIGEKGLVLVTILDGVCWPALFVQDRRGHGAKSMTGKVFLRIPHPPERSIDSVLGHWAVK